MLGQLTSLELAGVNEARAFPWDDLVDLASAFSHLACLDLPGYAVPKATRDRVRAALPGARFVSFDRRRRWPPTSSTRGGRRTRVDAKARSAPVW